MNNIYILGNHFNGLEFFVYILIPTSIILIILVYIFFNIGLLKLSYDFDLNSLLLEGEKSIEDNNENKDIYGYSENITNTDKIENIKEKI